MGRYLQEWPAYLMRTVRRCQIPKMNFHGGVHLCSIWPSLWLCDAKQFKKEKRSNVRWPCFILKGFFVCYICVVSSLALASFWFVACLMITSLLLSHAGSVFNLHLVCYSGTGIGCASDWRISLFRRSILTANLWPQRVSERETRSTAADETPSFYFLTMDIFCYLVFFFPFKGL